MREKLVEGCWEPDGLGLSQLSSVIYVTGGTVHCCTLHSVYSQIVTGVHTQFTDD